MSEDFRWGLHPGKAIRVRNQVFLGLTESHLNPRSIATSGRLGRAAEVRFLDEGLPGDVCASTMPARHVS